MLKSILQRSTENNTRVENGDHKFDKSFIIADHLRKVIECFNQRLRFVVSFHGKHFEKLI